MREMIGVMQLNTTRSETHSKPQDAHICTIQALIFTFRKLPLAQFDIWRYTFLHRLILLQDGEERKGVTMMHHQETVSKQVRYCPDESISACALCGKDMGAVYFKGKLVCEDCIGMVKQLY
jgi:hypothetical protein